MYSSTIDAQLDLIVVVTLREGHRPAGPQGEQASLNRVPTGDGVVGECELGCSEGKEARAAQQSEAASVVRPARSHASMSEPVDRLPIRDPEPAGTRLGALDDRSGDEHALR